MGSRQTTMSGGAASSRPLRAIGYLRVSTSGQAEHGLGLEAQREAVRRYAAEQGYNLLEVVSEAASGGVRDGETLSYEHRPVLLSLREQAKAGEYDVLLVAKLDRLSRDYPSLAVFERELQKVGVEVVSVAEQNGDGPMAEFIRGQVALVAQLERAMILERVGAGKALARKRGAYVGGGVPFGYTASGKGGKLEIVKELEPIVVSIFQAVKEGDSPGRVARDLDSRGVPSPKGGRWSRQAVTIIVRNPTYAGEHFGKKRAQPAIVSRQAWNAANAALDARRRSGLVFTAGHRLPCFSAEPRGRERPDERGARNAARRPSGDE
jgi:site-specific DNA recombinase